MTDCVQFMSGKSQRWSLVSEFINDETDTLPFYGIKTAVDWVHSPTLNPRAQAIIDDGYDALDELCDMLGLSGAQRRIVYSIEALKFKALGASKIFEECREYAFTGRLSSDLTDEQLKKCLAIIGDKSVQKNTDDWSKSRKAKMRSGSADHKVRALRRRIPRIPKTPKTPKTALHNSIRCTCPKCHKSDVLPRDSRDPHRAFSVSCPCVECQVAGDFAIWMDWEGKVIAKGALAPQMVFG